MHMTTTSAMAAELREQSRARYPDESGFVERNGVRVCWERYGAGEQTVLLLPTWEIAHSRIWKCQIPYLARRFQVVTFDPRGNGRSDRPTEASAYDRREFARDAIAILDALGVKRTVVVSWCTGVGVLLAAEYPERVSALVDIASDLPLSAEPSDETGYPFDEVVDTDEGWAKWKPPLLAAGLARLRGVLLRRGIHGAAFDEADRGRDRLGAAGRPAGDGPGDGG